MYSISVKQYNYYTLYSIVTVTIYVFVLPERRVTTREMIVFNKTNLYLRIILY